MWVIRTAQPWQHMEDPYLRAAFQYANPNAHLFGRTWVAKFAHEAYLDMRYSVIDELKVSLFSLISIIPSFPYSSNDTLTVS